MEDYNEALESLRNRISRDPIGPLLPPPPPLLRVSNFTGRREVRKSGVKDFDEALDRLRKGISRDKARSATARYEYDVVLPPPLPIPREGNFAADAVAGLACNAHGFGVSLLHSVPAGLEPFLRRDATGDLAMEDYSEALESLRKRISRDPIEPNHLLSRFEGLPPPPIPPWPSLKSAFMVASEYRYDAFPPPTAQPRCTALGG
ncbi:uncharacterized protein G2W53_017093 [Senna tora]|uniref:Uncharacterized protein n=1 Tax=Senna tora TaxID=362788 RepID=A0A834TXP7_9FABA|nr:uncharacterized protein G2W53_017093 [Senna tora]